MRGIALFALAPVLALAQAGADCKPDGNQQQLNACAVRDFQAADTRLNIRYSEVMAQLDADGRTRLRHEQREWLRRRDPACKSAARPNEGGSAWPLFFYGCMEKASTERTQALAGWGRKTP